MKPSNQLSMESMLPHRRRGGALFLSLFLVLGLVTIQANTITRIPTLGGSMVSATAQNNLGQVVGFSTLTGDQVQHGFLFSNGTMIDLGTLGGTFSQAVAVNDQGEVAGEASTANNAEFHAFLYTGGTMIDLGTLGGNSSSSMAVNEVGQVTGEAFFAGNFESHAFLYTGGVMVDLGTLGGSSSTAVSMNDLGEVVGDSLLPNFDSRPFVYRGGTMIDLGGLGGSFGLALDINNAGTVVGESETGSFETHAFLHANGVMVDLGTLGGMFSSAYKINEAGQVIGDSTLAGEQDYHAFLYQNGVMIDLGTLGGTFSTAIDINDQGMIVGDATDANEDTFPFLYHNGVMQNLNDLLPPNSGWDLWSVRDISNGGHILGFGLFNGEFSHYQMTLVQPNQPPTAVAGPDQVLDCPGTVQLDGSGSSDPDGDVLLYEWRLGGVLVANGSQPAIVLGNGSHTLELTVTDPLGESDQDTMTVTIEDLVQPTVTCPVSRSLTVDMNCNALVPDLTGSVVASDNCTDSVSLQRTQNPAAGTVVGPGQHVVTVTVTDEAGNSSSCTTTLMVTDATLPAN